MKFSLFNVISFTCFGPIDHFRRISIQLETTITICFVNINIYIQCTNLMFLTTTAACTNILKYLLQLLCLKMLKFLNQISSCPFYFRSPKEAKRPPPRGFVIWRSYSFSVVLLMFEAHCVVIL
jgi:hypothetical protein